MPRIIFPEEDGFGAGAAAPLPVDFEEACTEKGGAARDVKPRRHPGKKAFGDGFNAPPDDGVDGAAHADVGDEAGSAGQHRRIGRLHMRVRPENRRGASVHIMSEADFFRGGFRVKIEEDDAVARDGAGEQTVRHREGVFVRPIRLTTATGPSDV